MSSRSLRGWLLAKFAKLDFEEKLVAPDDAEARKEILLLSPSILVPRLIHEGVIGLMAAVDSFDPKGAASLRTYAEYRIRGAMLDYLKSRKVDPLTRSHRKRVKAGLDLSQVTHAISPAARRARARVKVRSEVALRASSRRALPSL